MHGGKRKPTSSAHAAKSAQVLKLRAGTQGVCDITGYCHNDGGTNLECPGLLHFSGGAKEWYLPGARHLCLGTGVRADRYPHGTRGSWSHLSPFCLLPDYGLRYSCCPQAPEGRCTR